MKRAILTIPICLALTIGWSLTFAQSPDDLELALDLSSATMPTPNIFKPNINLSGRGFYQDSAWPQGLASKEALESWQKDIGFKGFYRLQYNLWEISQFAKDKEAETKILANYEVVIKNVSDAGGTVLLNIFGTPQGMGRILDGKGAPVDLAAYKELIKNRIKDLSCEKKYNIWYEVWNAPDLEDFFLGRQQEYLNIYRLVSESIKELESQYKIHIPVGGPGTSWWFHSIEGNTPFTPEKSLIYQLIKYCDYNHLPLDFVTWHAFSSDSRAESESTIYKKDSIKLIRDWLSYFRLDNNTPLIIDEWNYDRDANVLPARREKSYISASYIPARIKGMCEAGIDNQIYFSLEDFQNNKESVNRNVGVFYYTSGKQAYKVGAKVSFNVFKMLKELGPDMYSVKLNDEFAGALLTKSGDSLEILIYNYIDPEIASNYISSNIINFSPSEIKFILNIVRSDELPKLIAHSIDPQALHASNKIKALFKKAQELSDLAKKFESTKRIIKINLKNIKGDYLYSRFTADLSCSLNCEFKPALEKELNLVNTYQEELTVNPYSVNLIILKKKPQASVDNNVIGK
ncbi:MAG: hypothetical protein NTZ63_07310 [Candidatus Omnitrophica bacterium]|nr:hypothetical protein [Candidatus Omnitrophota bacterium]